MKFLSKIVVVLLCICTLVVMAETKGKGTCPQKDRPKCNLQPQTQLIMFMEKISLEDLGKYDQTIVNYYDCQRILNSKSGWVIYAMYKDGKSYVYILIKKRS